MEASKRDRKKATLIRELYEIRKVRSICAKVLEKFLKMYDILQKERFEKSKISTPRTLKRLDIKINHLQKLVDITSARFNYIIKEKIRILDDIFEIALPK